MVYMVILVILTDHGYIRSSLGVCNSLFNGILDFLTVLIFIEIVK